MCPRSRTHPETQVLPWFLTTRTSSRSGRVVRNPKPQAKEREHPANPHGKRERGHMTDTVLLATKLAAAASNHASTIGNHFGHAEGTSQPPNPAWQRTNALHR